MKRATVKGIVIAVMAAMALTGLSCSKDKAEKKDAVGKPPGHEKMVDRYQKDIQESKEVVVATVNGAGIRMSELITKMNDIAPAFARTPQQLTPEIDQKVKQEALSVLIFRELAIQEAVRQGMKVGPEVVDQDLSAVKANMGSEDEFRKYLDMTGSDEGSLRKSLERNRLFDMIVEKEIFGKIKGDENNDQAAEKRRQEWEQELKKAAKIETTIDVTVKADARDAGKR